MKLSKKVISFLLSLLMTLSLLPATMLPAFAEGETAAATTATVSFTSQMSGGFLHAPQFDVAVASDKAEAYGYTDSVEGVSALDVLVAAHELTFGSDFTKDTATDYLVIEKDNVEKQFGVDPVEGWMGDTYRGGFFLNHAFPNDGTEFDNGKPWVEYNGTTVGTQAVKDGDLVEFFFYENEYLADTYTWFLDADGNYSRKFIADAGEDLELSLNGFYASEGARCKDEMEFVNYDAAQPIADQQISIVDLKTGALTPIEGAVTDEDGIVTLSFDDPGTYWITSYGEDDYGMMTPIMTLTEIEVTVPVELPITNNVGMFKPGEKMSVTGTEGAYVLHLDMESNSLDKVFVGYASEATDEKAIPIAIEAEPFTVDIPVASVAEPIVLAFHSKSNGKWYNRTLTIDLEKKTATFDPTQITLEQFDGMTEEEALARAAADTSVETVNALIAAIQVQARDENTDKYCKLAKAYYDALSDRDKEKVEESGYFGEDTGDASKDDPRNQDEIGEKELLVVSFGTSFNDSRVATIKAVEDALAKAYPDYSVRRAFTAQIIINHIQSRDGEAIDNMQQALDRAVANGVKELVVQPTHLMHGAEYDEMCEALKAYEGKIEKIIISEPLLSSESDKEIVAKASVDEVIKDSTFDTLEAAEAAKTAIVFMGHGTSHEANVTYAEMQKVYEDLGYKNVFVGTVEGKPASTALPDIKTAVEAAGYTSVILRPLMVVAGDHANNDMADVTEGSGSWYDALARGGEFEVEGADQPVDIGKGFGEDKVTCQVNGLGEIKDVQGVYVAHVKEALIEKIDLTITNNTGMFKAVTAYLEKDGEDTTLVMALSGTGYKKLFKGTYEAAVAEGTGIADKWIEGTTNADGKLEFRIPIAEGETFVPCVAISESYYNKYLNGQNTLERAFYPRQFEINEEAKTLVTGDYDETADFAVASNVADFKVAEKASTRVVGGPNSNNYNIVPTLAMQDTTYDKVTYPTVVSGKLGEASADLKDGKFEISLLNAPNTEAFKDKTPIEMKFHVAEGTPYAEAGTDVVRNVTIDKMAKTITIEGTPLTSVEAKLEDGVYTLPKLEAGPSAMFNHFIADSKVLIVNGDEAIISFITDGSTKSIRKYSRIALGKSSELVEKDYQPELAEGTTIIDGVLQAKEKEDDPDQYLFMISLPKADVEKMMNDDAAEDIYITVWNKEGSSAEKIPGWYKASNDIYLTLGRPGKKLNDIAEPADITATISKAGEVVMAQKEITVEDANFDGKLDVNEALIAAHDAAYEGGAAAGYLAKETQYGLGIFKLWGDESGSYGYYLNNKMCMSLDDAVADGDHLDAFSYKDATGWSDTYTYFEKAAYQTPAGEAVAVKLMAANGYDDNWNPVFAASTKATLKLYTEELKEADVPFTVEAGEDSYNVKVDKAGVYFLVATSADPLYVPAVTKICVATDPTDITVTIAKAGEVVMAQETVNVKDINSDGKLDVNEALIAAHDKSYEGGAAAGYATAETQWGLSLMKLWGDENGGSYGYYINNTMCMSLSDEVKEGDYLDAFSYKDAAGYSDHYTYFDSPEYAAAATTNYDVVLSEVYYDYDNWKMVTERTVKATIKLYDENLKASEVPFTCEAGTDSYTLTIGEPGTYFLIASSEDPLFVPAVAKLTVQEAPFQFDDVQDPSAWFYNDVYAAYNYKNANGTRLMSGYGNSNNFGPNDPLVRAQFAVMLHRLDNDPDVAFAEVFPDVKDGEFYSKACVWAKEAGVITGYENGYFGVNDNINREQLATILYRYAKEYKKLDVSAAYEAGDLSKFADASAVSKYAQDALKWANGAGIITGTKEGNIDPQGNAVRAQVAAMFMRYITYIENLK